MRKIISAVIALIMMMSAAPVFAEGEQIAGEVPETETNEQIQIEESKGEPPVADHKDPDCKQNCNNDSVSDSLEWVQIELTIYDADGNRLEDEEEIQIREGMTLHEMLKEFNEDVRYEFDWKKCEYTINEKAVTDDIETIELKPEDSVTVKVTDGENPVISEEPIVAQEEENEKGDVQFLAVPEKTLDNAYEKTASHVNKTAANSGWEFGSEWIVLGLSRSEKLSEADKKAYCDRVAAYVKNRKSDKMDESMSTANSRLIITLTSIGCDPTDVEGCNLLKPLADMNYVCRQGISGPVWALIAFDSASYDIPEAKTDQKQTTREALVTMLVGAQIENKGWAFSGKNPDVDMTCMVIQALTPYYNDENPQVKTAIDNGLKWLSAVQQDDGSFRNEEADDVSSEAQSQVIVALTGLGINPATHSDFVKNNNSALDALMKFYVSGGGFKHIADNWKANGLATQQGYYALAAYYRFINGKSSLYNINDKELEKFTGVAKVGDKGDSTKIIETAGKAAGKTRSLGYLALGSGNNIDKNLIKENFGNPKDNESAIARQKAYNEYIKSVRVNRTLPWIYISIGALALMALLVILRNRKPE